MHSRETNPDPPVMRIVVSTLTAMLVDWCRLSMIDIRILVVKVLGGLTCRISPLVLTAPCCSPGGVNLFRQIETLEP